MIKVCVCVCLFVCLFERMGDLFGGGGGGVCLFEGIVVSNLALSMNLVRLFRIFSDLAAFVFCIARNAKLSFASVWKLKQLFSTKS